MKKSVLITGAAGGIGQALCEEFTREGYFVIATDLAGTTVEVCDVFIECDLEEICHSSEALNAFFDSVNNVLSGGRLSVLVNNAAIQILGRTANISREDWFRSMNVNVTAPFFLVQAFIDDLEKSRGCVINIASVHFIATKPGFVSYATSKAALIGLTQSLAVDLGGTVRINAINPAATDTPMLRAGFENNQKGFEELQKMHPIGRIAQPTEVAKVAVFLASDSASFLTGTSVDVDGGILARLHDPD